MIIRELRDVVFGIRELSAVCRFDSCLTGLESAVKVFFRGTTRRGDLRGGLGRGPRVDAGAGDHLSLEGSGGDSAVSIGASSSKS